MLSRRKVQILVTWSAFIIVVLTVLTILVVFMSAFDSVKRENALAKAEYTGEVEAFERDLESREWISYKVREGDGLNHALVASGIRSELGLTSSMEYNVCTTLVLQRNSNMNASLRSGRTIMVPSGTNKKVVQK